MALVASVEVMLLGRFEPVLGWPQLLQATARIVLAYMLAGAVFGIVSSAATLLGDRNRPWYLVVSLVLVVPLPGLVRAVSPLWYVRIAVLVGALGLVLLIAFASVRSLSGPFRSVAAKCSAPMKFAAAMLVLGSVAIWTWSRHAIESAQATRSRPNVVLISLDTVRADHLELYGYERETAPSLSALARESVVFDAAYAPEPWTLPSHMTMMTSLSPLVHGVGSMRERLDRADVTLAEQLQSAGYRTVGFVASAESSYIGGLRGFADGFDVYSHPPNWQNRTLGTSLFELWNRFVAGSKPGDAGDTTDAAIHFLERRGQEPFFLFLHYYDAHSDTSKLPYEAPEELIRQVAGSHENHFEGCDARGRCATELLMSYEPCGDSPSREIGPEHLRDIIAHYDAGIRFVDRQLARLFRTLDELGIDEHTLIVVTSDHGEEFLEHGRFLHTQLYEELLRVPLIVRLPGARHAGERSGAPVELADLMPTILDVAGVDAPAGMQGESLLPLAAGEAPRDDALYSSWTPDGETEPREIGVRIGSRGLIYKKRSRCTNDEPTLEAFNLVEPSRPTPIALEEPFGGHSPLFSRLLSWERRALEASAARSREAGFEMDPDVRRKLEALGYLQH